MKLSDKFGYTAVKAVELIQKGTSKSPKEAWEKAGYQVLEKKVYVEKGCPKNAFLGLCEEGIVKGVPRGKYTKSVKNKKYALKAFEKLQEDPSIKNDIKKFWEIVGPKPTISHNYQLNVVIQLMEHNLLNTKRI
jgi:hypothetical protein